MYLYCVRTIYSQDKATRAAVRHVHHIQILPSLYFPKQERNIYYSQFVKQLKITIHLSSGPCTCFCTKGSCKNIKALFRNKCFSSHVHVQCRILGNRGMNLSCRCRRYVQSFPLQEYCWLISQLIQKQFLLNF